MTGSSICRTVIVGCLAFSAAVNAQGGFRQHSAHEHGLAQSNVAVDGNQLLIELSSPAANLVGFEHTPTGDAEIAKATSVAQILKDVSQMFRPSPAADCTIDSIVVEMPWELPGTFKPGAAPAHQHVVSEFESEGHSDISAEYRFTCTNPDGLRELDMVLLQTFPQIERVRAQFVTPSNQGAAELTGLNRLLSL